MKGEKGTVNYGGSGLRALSGIEAPFLVFVRVGISNPIKKGNLSCILTVCPINIIFSPLVDQRRQTSLLATN